MITKEELKELLKGKFEEYIKEEASKLLENDKYSLQEKYEVCLKLNQFDKAKKYLLKIKELQNKK
jgi:hypothetical protein